jgi:hypothetical protein
MQHDGQKDDRHVDGRKVADDPGLVPGHHDRTRDELDESQACRADAPSRPGDVASMADHEQACPVGGSEQRPQRGVRLVGPAVRFRGRRRSGKPSG